LNIHVRDVYKNFIKNLVSNGLKNIFISGTCYEYGKKDGELNEKMRINPKTSYAVAKNYLRKYVLGLRKKYKFNLIWGRIFYVYGKIKSRKTLYSSILDSFKKKKKLEVQGELIRDYLSVQELSKYIVELSLKRKNIVIQLLITFIWMFISYTTIGLLYYYGKITFETLLIWIVILSLYFTYRIITIFKSAVEVQSEIERALMVMYKQICSE
jgi:hypothetical protein